MFGFIWFFIIVLKFYNGSSLLIITLPLFFQRATSDVHWFSYVVCRQVAEASCLVEEELACGGDWHCEVSEENLSGSFGSDCAEPGVGEHVDWHCEVSG